MLQRQQQEDFIKMYPYNLGNLLKRKDNKIAIVHETSYTFKDVDNRANGFSNGLLKNGIVQGDRVAILSENSIDLVCAYLGVLRIGAVAVLINPKLPQDLITYIIIDSQAKILLTENNFNEYRSNNISPVIKHMSEEDPAFILYTSGSTNKPKGVIIPHRHLWTLEQKTKLDFWDKVRMLISAPLCHMNGLSSIEICLCSGASAYLMIKFDSTKAIGLIIDHKINYLSVVPTMMKLLLNDVGDNDLSCIKHIAMASAPVSIGLYNEVKRKIPSAGIYIAYGCTEAGPGLFGFHPTKPTPELSVGYRIPGIDYRIVDGILQVRSPSMMLKYNNFSASFTEDNFFITNDLFREEDGFFYFLGRADDMFVSGGDNIYPKQIESILEEHPLVSAAAVIGIEDEIKGSKPYAFVVSDASEEELKNHILKFLPNNHCPRKIWFLTEIPLTSVNKVNKNLLKDEAKRLLNN